MNAEISIVDDGGEDQKVKHLGAVSPHIDGTVLAKALVIEAVHLGDLTALVVAAKERHSVGVADLQGQQKEKCLYAVVASVDVVAEEDVVGVGTLAAHFEELLDVVELSMKIAANLGVERGTGCVL